jgi:murein DD-endopeptidase MepM/ murein hydrolase activator NlpD
MRFPAELCSRLSARITVLAVLTAGVTGCSGDTTRFSENPFSGQQVLRPTAEVTGSVPQGRVDVQGLPDPSRTANISTGVASGGGGMGSYQPPATTPATRLASAAVRPVPVSRGGGTARASSVHVVTAGQTLTSIARHYGRSRVEIAKANHIDAYAVVRVGQHLIIPGVPPTQTTTGHDLAARPAPAQEKPQAVASTQTVSHQSGGTARVVTPATDATAEATEEAGKPPSFRWPVRGRVIAGYGAKVNGTPNDGINLAVPEGTSVKAAEDGVVAYAGNELKGYGNLVLVRHPNGFVTAYAHASDLLVKRGDQVKRGQILARAGQTGDVTSPQLHFEVRKGSTPIDPTEYLTTN